MDLDPEKTALPTPHDAMTREQAIDQATAMLDDALFRALQEPARVAVLRRLMLLGRADVGQVAEELPQERSVISRHLQVLLDAGLVRVQRAGKHRIYEVDGPAIVQKFEAILQQLYRIAPYCCPPDTPEET